MPTYEFEGKTYDAPEGMTADQVVAIARGQSLPANEQPQTTTNEQPTASATASPFGEATPSPGYAPVNGTVDPAELSHSKDWLDASRILYKANTGQDWSGSDGDLADTGLNSMGYFNWNLPTMGVDAAKLAMASPEQKQAFLYLMETYDHLGYTWGGAWRAMKGIALDPTTYVGLSTFGLGTVGQAGAEIASKEGLKAALRLGIQTGIEGMAQAAAQNTLRQTVEKETGARQDFSYAELAKNAALGGVAGGALGAAASGVGTFAKAAIPALRKDAPWSKFTRDEAEKAINGSAEKRSPDGVRGSAEGPTGGHASAGDHAPASAPAEGSPVGETGPTHQGSTESKGSPPPAEATHIAEQGETATVESLSKPAVDPVGPADGDAGAHVEPAVPDAVADGAAVSPGAAEVRPEVSRALSIMDAIKTVAKDSGARLFPTTRAETTEAAAKASELLATAKPQEMRRVVEALRREAVTPEQQQLLRNVFKETGDRMTAETRDLYGQFSAAQGQAREDLFKTFAQAKAARDVVLAGDKALSSMDGRVLGDRVGSFNTGFRRDLSEENILAAHGVTWERATAEQKAWAQAEYFRQYDAWATKAETTEAVRQADQDIQAAYEAGDTARAIQLSGEKQALVDAQVRQAQAEAGVVNSAASGAAGLANKGLAYLNEYIISTVFTSGTLVVNTIPSIVKTVYRPALDYVVRGPADYAAFRQVTAQYMAMSQSIGMAAQAARAAFTYERHLLSSEPNRLLEHGPVIPGRLGQAIRLFPRLLGATDEFFAQMNYRGFVVSQAVSDAVEHGMAQGMKGDALDSYVRQVAQDAGDHMFERHINAPDVIAYLRDKGQDRGLTGDKLDVWVKTQLDKNEGLFKIATSQAGKSYADDLLFKRQFSGDDWASRAAQSYETFVNKNPVMRVLGQMFFRTPVRVFEEGMRLTAGANLISGALAGSLYKDLLGANGAARQVKAQGEMLLSYGIATWAIAQYGQGKLTSGGPADAKARRGREDAGDWQANSYRAGDTSWSFRNLDPFSTPLKIIANVMDRMEDLAYRKAQGEFVDHHEKEALAWTSVAVGSIASAITDANLMEGITDLEKLGSDLTDPEHKEAALQRFLGSKAQLMVPNEWTKLAQQGAPNMNDPQTLGQYLKTRINPADPKVPRQYDTLGNVRKVANPSAAIDGIGMATAEQLKRGRSDKELAVLKEISNLEIASGQSFGVMPYKTPEWGLKGQDLRQVYDDQGRSYYDRAQDILRTFPVTDALYGALVANKAGSVGTRQNIGIRVELAKGILSDFRDMALVRLVAQESKMREEYIRSLRDNAAAVAGKKDVSFLPYR